MPSLRRPTVVIVVAALPFNGIFFMTPSPTYASDLPSGDQAKATRLRTVTSSVPATGEASFSAIDRT